MVERITLTKALKQKNRLAGEIAKLKGLIIRENVLKTRTMGDHTDATERTVDIRQIQLDLNARINDIVELKTAIARANIGIISKMHEMAEAKALLEFFRGNVPTANEDQVQTDYNGKVVCLTKYEDVIGQAEIDKIVDECQRHIERLQDEIDEYNATTKLA